MIWGVWEACKKSQYCSILSVFMCFISLFPFSRKICRGKLLTGPDIIGKWAGPEWMQPVHPSCLHHSGLSSRQLLLLHQHLSPWALRRLDGQSMGWASVLPHNNPRPSTFLEGIFSLSLYFFSLSVSRWLTCSRLKMTQTPKEKVITKRERTRDSVIFCFTAFPVKSWVAAPQNN